MVGSTRHECTSPFREILLSHASSDAMNSYDAPVDSRPQEDDNEPRSQEIAWFKIFYDLVIAKTISRAGNRTPVMAIAHPPSHPNHGPIAWLTHEKVLPQSGSTRFRT